MRIIGYYLNLGILIGFFSGSDIFANEAEAFHTTPTSTDMKIEFNNGKINAKLNRASLAKVLYEFSSRQGFILESRVDLSIYKVTRKFVNMPAVEFVKHLLKSFDYTLIAGNDSNIEKLIVLSASHSSKDQLFVNERAKQQSISAGDYQAVLPGQATGSKLPSFTPITNETGPISDKPTLELPKFEPVENKTGPLM